MSHYLGIFVALCAVISQGEACTCAPSHPQYAFNKADFVVKVKILTDRVVQKKKDADLWVKMGLPLLTEGVYVVAIEKAFKGAERINKLQGSIIDENQRITQNNIYTPMKGSLCGTKFNRGETYVLTGNIVNERLEVKLCDWSMRWEETTKLIKEGLRHRYNTTCDVITCFSGNCREENTCNWEVAFDGEIDDCYVKHRLCVQKDNKCQWNKPEQAFNICSVRSGRFPIIP